MYPASIPKSTTRHALATKLLLMLTVVALSSLAQAAISSEEFTGGDAVVNGDVFELIPAPAGFVDARADLNDDGIVNVVGQGILRTLIFGTPGPGGTTSNGSN